MAPQREGSQYYKEPAVTLPPVLHRPQIPESQLKRLKKTGELISLRPGWYTRANQLPPERANAQRALILAQSVAHAHDLPYGVAFSHSTAALIHGFPSLGAIPRPEVTNYRTKTFHRTGLRVTARTSDGPEITRVRGLPVTPLDWTCVDLLRTLNPPQALAAADYALRSGCTATELSSLNRAWKYKAGRIQAAEILKLADAGAESPQESILRFWVHAARIGTVTTQRRVLTELGNYYLDIAIEELKIAIEYDGEIKYTTPQDLIREKKRETAIREQGWEFVHVTKDDFKDIRAFLAKLRELARFRGGELSAGSTETSRVLSMW